MAYPAQRSGRGEVQHEVAEQPGQMAEVAALGRNGGRPQPRLREEALPHAAREPRIVVGIAVHALEKRHRDHQGGRRAGARAGTRRARAGRPARGSSTSVAFTASKAPARNSKAWMSAPTPRPIPVVRVTLTSATTQRAPPAAGRAATARPPTSRTRPARWPDTRVDRRRSASAGTTAGYCWRSALVSSSTPSTSSRGRVRSGTTTSRRRWRESARLHPPAWDPGYRVARRRAG